MCKIKQTMIAAVIMVSGSCAGISYASTQGDSTPGMSPNQIERSISQYRAIYRDLTSFYKKLKVYRSLSNERKHSLRVKNSTKTKKVTIAHQSGKGHIILHPKQEVVFNASHLKKMAQQKDKFVFKLAEFKRPIGTFTKNPNEVHGIQVCTILG